VSNSTVESTTPELDSKTMFRCLGLFDSGGLTSLIDETDLWVNYVILVRNLIDLHNMVLRGLIFCSSRLELYVLIMSWVNWSQTLFLRRRPLRCMRTEPDFRIFSFWSA
jgi:hypothetical protein